MPEGFPRRELILGLAARFAAHPAVERVWLFGSRARGEHFERSDIDLAVEAPAMDRYDWLKIKLHFEDDPPTLLGVDLLRLDEVSPDLRDDVRGEGILLHERTRPEGTRERSRERARSSG